MRRVTYNRADIDSAISAAKKVQDGKPVYIFATCEGFTIAANKPPFGQKYIEILENGHRQYQGGK